MDEKLGLGGYMWYAYWYFDIECVRSFWGHSVNFSQNWTVTQKWLIVERNGQKFGPQGCMQHAY